MARKLPKAKAKAKASRPKARSASGRAIKEGATAISATSRAKVRPRKRRPL
jgi:hypothetical protein